jgi:hypothetical protein
VLSDPPDPWSFHKRAAVTIPRLLSDRRAGIHRASKRDTADRAGGAAGRDRAGRSRSRSCSSMRVGGRVPGCLGEPGDYPVTTCRRGRASENPVLGLGDLVPLPSMLNVRVPEHSRERSRETIDRFPVTSRSAGLQPTEFSESRQIMARSRLTAASQPTRPLEGTAWDLRYGALKFAISVEALYRLA